MEKIRHHQYLVQNEWKGDLGTGTSTYRSYRRDLEISAAGKNTPIFASSDPLYRGDATRYNPEELLVGSISACHMLWVLHLCADAGIVVTGYKDEAIGEMIEHPDGSGEFTRVLLRPQMVITDASRIADAVAVHEHANRVCCIARSMNFRVEHTPIVTASGPLGSRGNP